MEDWALSMDAIPSTHDVLFGLVPFLFDLHSADNVRVPQTEEAEAAHPIPTAADGVDVDVGR